MSSTMIPLFPLSLVAFPGEQVNLHIFEPRYRQLFEDCDVSATSFGIIAYVDGKMSDIGTEMKLDRIVKRYDDGKLDVSTLGVQPFSISKYLPEYPGKMYPGGEVSWLSWSSESDLQTAIQVVDLLKQLYTHMQIDNVKVTSAQNFQTTQVIHKVGLTIHQEMQVLAMPLEVQRLEYLLQHLRRFVPQVIEMEELRRKAALNGHFKNIVPPAV